MKLTVIASEELSVEILGVEKVSDKRASEYESSLNRLVKQNGAKYLGRAVEEGGGTVFKMYTLPAMDGQPGRTIHVQDYWATSVVKSLVDKQGNLRRLVIEGFSPE